MRRLIDRLFVVVTAGFLSPISALGAQQLVDLVEKDQSREPTDSPTTSALDAREDLGIDEKLRTGLVGITTEQRQAAAARIQEVFGSEISAAKTLKQKSGVARAMLELVVDVSNRAEAYVLLETALWLAIQGQDPDAMNEAVSLLHKLFNVDLGSKRRDALVNMSKAASLDSLSVVVDALVAEANAAAELGLFNVAKDAAKAAVIGSRRLRDPARQKSTAELGRQLAEREKAQTKVKPLLDRLATDPRDQQTKLELGMHRCFEEANWKAGLELLADCSDPALAQAARDDLSVDGSSEMHTKAGDRWFALYEKAGGKVRNAFGQRAKYHYERAMGEATGLASARILKRLAEISKLDSAQANWIVIFRSADPAIWNTKTDDRFLNFAMPLEAVPPTVRYVRVRRTNGDAIVLPITKLLLGRDTYGEKFGWLGGSKKLMKDTFLGVCDNSRKLSPNDAGQVFVGDKDGTICSGWGFGHKLKSGTQAGMAWDGQTVPREPLEISVLTRELTARERNEVKLLH